MAAKHRIYKDSGFWRAVCFECRSDNAQRTYWRTPHRSEADAKRLLDEHLAGHAAEAAVCQWFLRCENPATKDVEHPTVGWVPICDEHLDWLSDQPNGGPKWVPPIAAKHAQRVGIA